MLTRPSRPARPVARPAIAFLLSSLLFSALPLTAATGAAGQRTVQSDRVVAGGPKDSLEVRHLVLRGANVEIGRALADIARDRYGTRLERSRDPLGRRAQRLYLSRNAPILLDRMRGVAEAFGRPFEDDAWDFTALGFTDLRAGCSV